MPRFVLYIEQPLEGVKKRKELGWKDKLAACSRKKLMGAWTGMMEMRERDPFRGWDGRRLGRGD